MVGSGVFKGWCVEIVMFLVDLVVIVWDVMEVVGDDVLQVFSGVLFRQIVNFLDDKDCVVFSEYYDGGLIMGMFMLWWDCWKYVYYVGYDLQLFDFIVDFNEFYNFVCE